MTADVGHNCCHFFVDEAGDTTLFANGGKVLVGTESCSNCLMLGLAQIDDHEAVSESLEELRRSLLADPYFAQIPSMQVSAGKTARCFHAKDDIPEVRREVFRLISTLGARVTVAIRRKRVLAEIGLEARRLGTKALIGPNDLYDDLVTKLFSNGHLGWADYHNITFARRGKKARIQALAKAIDNAKQHAAKLGIEAKPCTIAAAFPSECGGLQVIDYYLWALQRMIERGESRYFDYVSSQFLVIMDLDDTATRAHGKWYYGTTLAELKKKCPLVS